MAASYPLPARAGRRYADAMDSALDVAIVGGGVAGLSLARACARAGLSVALFERGEAGPTGASALPAALLNPWRGRKGAAHPDDLAGLATVWRWAEELAREGLDAGAQRSAVLRVATSSRQADVWRARADAEPSLAWLAPDDVPAPYHAPFGALRVRDGGWLRPERWLAAVADSARAHGATLRHGATVDGARRDGAGPWRLLAADGTVLASASTIVTCTGADDGPDAVQDGAALAWPSWERTRGEVVTVQGGPAFATPLAGGIYGASADGRAWIGGGHRPPERADPDAPAKLRSAFAWSLPGLARSPIVDVWSGVRAKRAGARPDVREVAPGAWTFGAFAGRGFLCAAAEAERWATAYRRGG